MRDRARELRKTMTESERRVWTAIRDGRCDGLRFRRQEVMGQYIADFYCPSEKLVLEIDGHSHDMPEQQDRDHWRDIALAERGLWVLRLRNQYVTHATAEQLRAVLLERILSYRNSPSAS